MSGKLIPEKSPRRLISTFVPLVPNVGSANVPWSLLNPKLLENKIIVEYKNTISLKDNDFYAIFHGFCDYHSYKDMQYYEIRH